MWVAHFDWTTAFVWMSPCKSLRSLASCFFSFLRACVRHPYTRPNPKALAEAFGSVG